MRISFLIILLLSIKVSNAQSIIGKYVHYDDYVEILTDSTLKYKTNVGYCLRYSEVGFGNYKILHDSIISIETKPSNEFYTIEKRKDTTLIKSPYIKVIFKDIGKSYSYLINKTGFLIDEIQSDSIGIQYLEKNRFLSSLFDKISQNKFNFSEFNCKDSSINSFILNVSEDWNRISENEKFYFKFSNPNHSIISGKYYFKPKGYVWGKIKFKLKRTFSKPPWRWRFRKIKSIHTQRITYFTKAK